MQPTSDELLAQARSGDADALGVLLERCGPQVRSAIVGAIPAKWQSQLSLDDVLQQTYMDTILGLSRFLDARSDGLVGWLITLARRNLIDAFRMLDAQKRGGNHRKVDLPASFDSLADMCGVLGFTSQTPSRAAARNEATRRIMDDFQRLPKVYQQVIQCYDLDGQPVEVVAREMGRSPGAVFMLRARAHERLAEIMGSAQRYFSDVP